jgi:hypothetical protein
MQRILHSDDEDYNKSPCPTKLNQIILRGVPVKVENIVRTISNNVNDALET